MDNKGEAGMKMYPMERMVNQTLWKAIMTDDYDGEEKEFENEVFAIKPYCWTGENDWNFWFKLGDVYVRWYKYPLRDCECSVKDLTHEQFYAILEESMNSVRNGWSVETYERWWEQK